MNFKRIISSVLGIPLVILIVVFTNQTLIDIAFCIIALIAITEYLNAFSKKAKPIKWIAYVCAIMIAFIHIIPKNLILPIITVIIPTVIAIMFIQVIVTNMKTTFKDVIITFFGISYIVIFIMFLSMLRGIENGNILVWFAIITAWGTDIFAYIVGKAIGKHKFSKISPNKSLEGCIGGIVGAVVLVLIYTFFINKYTLLNFEYFSVAIITLFLSIMAQVGDFSASCIKRYVDIKDYGNLIPGHGGMLDRIDSLIFIAPFAYIIFSMI